MLHITCEAVGRTSRKCQTFFRSLYSITLIWIAQKQKKNSYAALIDVEHKLTRCILLDFNKCTKINLHIFNTFNFLDSLNQLFLLHMDEIIPNIVDNNNAVDAAIGCSTISVNEPGNVRHLVWNWIWPYVWYKFDRKPLGILKTPYRKTSIIIISCQLTSFPSHLKESIKWLKNASLPFAMLVIFPDTPWTTIIMVWFMPSILWAQPSWTAAKHVKLLKALQCR